MHFIKKYIEESFEIIELSNQFINAKIVVQQGFNLFSLVYKNIETIYFDKTLIENFQDRKLAGIPFMHPWANRLDRDKIFNRSFTMNDILNAVLYRDGNNLALHGLILKSDKWQIIDMSATDLKASCTAKLAFNETHLLDLFPFKHNIFITLELESEKLSQQTKINDQNKAIKLLLDKTKDLEKQNEKLKSDISTLTTEKANAEKTIQQNQKTIQGDKATISKLETTIKNNEREIERLSNLKWYKKLFGQK